MDIHDQERRSDEHTVAVSAVSGSRRPAVAHLSAGSAPSDSGTFRRLIRRTVRWPDVCTPSTTNCKVDFCSWKFRSLAFVFQTLLSDQTKKTALPPSSQHHPPHEHPPGDYKKTAR